MPLLRRQFLRNGLFSLPALGLASQAEALQPGAFIVPAGKTRIDALGSSTVSPPSMTR